MWRNWSAVLCWEYKCAATMENSIKVPHKIKNRTTV